MEIDISNLHHAYLLIGNTESAEAWFDTLLGKLDITRSGNPDLWVYKTDSFGIEEARELSDRARQKAFTGRKLFYIAADKYTAEAQNALLKTFEEPGEHTHFFLSVREEGMLLPTLLSRIQSHRVSGTESSAVNDAEEFLKLSIKDRMLFIKKFTEAEKNLQSFLDNLLKHLKENGEQAKILGNVYSIGRFGGDRSASARLILEHLALTL